MRNIRTPNPPNRQSLIQKKERTVKAPIQFFYRPSETEKRGKHADVRGAGQRRAAIRCGVESHVTPTLLQVGQRRHERVGSVLWRRTAGIQDNSFGGCGRMLLQTTEKSHRSPQENPAEENAALGCTTKGAHRLCSAPGATS